eukprot:1312373-Alexandrium_andersonii.AAC.1
MTWRVSGGCRASRLEIKPRFFGQHPSPKRLAVDGGCSVPPAAGHSGESSVFPSLAGACSESFSGSAQ